MSRAKIGLKVRGMDSSRTGLSMVRENLKSVRLNITKSDIEKFEREESEPLPVNEISKSYQEVKIGGDDRGNDNKTPDSNSRRNLIVNSGVTRRIHNVLKEFKDCQVRPDSSPYACWNCCHFFENAPVGIPEKIIDSTYYLKGNFCSYSCALRYIYPQEPDDFTLQPTTEDFSDGNELWEQRQLLEMLYREEYEFNDGGEGGGECHKIQIAPPRLALKIFGGFLSIEEYRTQHPTPSYCIYKEPMVSVNYQIEEAQPRRGHKTDSRPQYVQLDRRRVREAQKALQEQQNSHKRKHKSIKELTNK